MGKQLDPVVAQTVRRACSLHEAGHAEQAFELYQQIYPKIRNQHQALRLYAIAAFDLSLKRTAIDLMRSALKLKPMEPRYRVDLARMLVDFGDPVSALTEADRALALVPGHAQAAYYKASSMRRLGKAPEALDWLREESNRFKGDDWFPVTFAHLAESKECSSSDKLEALGYLADGIESAKDSELKRTMAFQVGLLSDSLGKYDDAFASFELANSMMPFVNRIKQHTAHTRQILKNWETIEPDLDLNECSLSGQPIFIVGMPRSGTSLVEQILASHPQVAAAGECGYVSDSIKNLKINSPPFNYALSPLSQEDPKAREAGLAIRSSLRERAGSDKSKRITDKLPANIMSVGFIMSVLPNARIIICERDPRDTCLSCYFQNFPRNIFFSFNFETCANYLADTRLVADLWCEKFPNAVTKVRYETLVESPDAEVRRLLDFTGLPFHEACLSHHDNSRHIVTASFDQANRPIYSSSVKRWKNYEKHLGGLTGVLNSRGVELGEL